MNEAPVCVALSSGYRGRGFCGAGDRRLVGGFINQPEKTPRFPGCGRCLPT